MLIRTVTNNTEETLLFAIEAKKGGSVAKSFLHCVFSDTKITPPDADSLVILLKDLLKDHNGVLYYCSDKDVFIEWIGSAKGIKTAIEGEIAKHCLQKSPNWSPEDFFHYYDINAHGEELRIICKHKIAKLSPEKFKLTPDLSTPVIKNLKFTPEQYIAFDNAIKTRNNRKAPEVLIVEDQAFSRTLLMGILSHQYKCHTAKNAAETLSVFAGLAPDIILLDVELPDSNGHAIAKFIRNIDPNVWIIMITANHYQADIIAAKENKVQGFIVKPYSKQKILEIMSNYNKLKKQV